MKRAALIAGISIAAFSAAPTDVRAWSGDFDSWSRGDRPASPYNPPAQQTTRPRPRKPERHESKTDKTPPAPSGLLHIIVSIDKQRATLFADGVSVASTAISSGTAAHPTPMGVFTVIQKDRHHISNLYNAPMPYMQRITWSGSALHEGPLPGYPASHGCVRLTSNFAQLLWKATKMGVRVVVTRPEVAPLAFDHPRLFVPRPKMVEAPGIPLPAPKPVTAAPEPAAAPGAALAVKPAFTSSATKIRTADATNTIGAAIRSVVGDDSMPINTSGMTERAANMPAAEQPTKPPVTDVPRLQTPPEAASVENAPAEAQTAETKPVEAAPAEAQAAEVKPAETTPSEAQAVEMKPAETAPVEIQGFEMWPVETAPVKTQAAEAKPVLTAPVEAQAAETKPVETTPIETQATEAQPVETAPVEAQAAEAKPVETAPVETQAAAAKPLETKPAATAIAETKPVPTTIAAPAPIIVDERPKAMPTTVVREANGRPISVFVSLKESKLYVRQGWKPLFDAPVSFEHPEQPIGTHVYTAMGFKVTGDGLRWTVVSIPSSNRRAAEVKSPKKGSKGHHEHVKPIEVAGPLPSPAAALDRIVMPPELVERISELITPGSSLIVSDNKLSDETGEYTDFIVLTR